jgi:L,D-transpeptidase catalytic domain
MRLAALLSTVPLVATAFTPARAQTGQAPTPPPAPSPGKVSIKVVGGVSAAGVRYVARGQRIRVRARVQPSVPGEVVILDVRGRGRKVSRHAVVGPAGQVSFSFRMRRRVSLRIRVRHSATPAQAAFRSRRVRMKAVVLRAGRGSRGRRVLLLQRGLRRLGFAVPLTGYYDPGTSRAVLAYRKASRMGRNGYASTTVYSRVLRRRGAFRPRFRTAGRHVEFDWSRQLLALVDGGRARRVYHASSGKASTPTVFGSFSFYSKTPGTNSHGMVFSNYFVGGYAVHGYKSVPSYPASHGCIRVPIPNAVDIFNEISLGEKIFVYR